MPNTHPGLTEYIPTYIRAQSTVSMYWMIEYICTYIHAQSTVSMYWIVIQNHQVSMTCLLQDSLLREPFNDIQL